jgi:hypothetical protein
MLVLYMITMYNIEVAFDAREILEILPHDPLS